MLPYMEVCTAARVSLCYALAICGMCSVGVVGGGVCGRGRCNEGGVMGGNGERWVTVVGGG